MFQTESYKPLNTRLYVPENDFFCELPNPTDYRQSNLVGFKACGHYSGDTIRPTCLEFNATNGQWEDKYKLPVPVYSFIAWENDQGMLLMGGSQKRSFYGNPTIQFFHNGSFENSFDLLNGGLSRSCGVEDYRNGSIILIGGVIPSGPNTGFAVRTVSRYGRQGFMEHLPNISESRHSHGCAGYYNDQQSEFASNF